MLLIFSALLVTLPTPTPLWLAVTLIGSQLTGFFLREQEPCGPSASARTTNRCHDPGCLSSTLAGSLNASWLRALMRKQAEDSLESDNLRSSNNSLSEPLYKMKCISQGQTNYFREKINKLSCKAHQLLICSYQCPIQNTLQREDLWLDRLLPHVWR